METFKAIMKWLASVALAIIAPFVLIIVGALIAAFGISIEQEWVTNAGVIVAALGVIWIMKGVFGD